MEIIDEIEPHRRGPYAGAVGYLDFGGNMDTCIALRTLVVQGNRAYIQAGAGIVADSDPASEYQETLNKARGLLTAIEVTERRTRQNRGSASKPPAAAAQNHAVGGSRPKIPWGRIGVWAFGRWAGIAAICIVVTVFVLIALVVYVKGQPKLSDPIRLPVANSRFR